MRDFGKCASLYFTDQRPLFVLAEPDTPATAICPLADATDPTIHKALYFSQKAARLKGRTPHVHEAGGRTAIHFFLATETGRPLVEPMVASGLRRRCTARAGEWLSDQKYSHSLVLSVFFILSRCALYAAGVSFDSQGIGGYWQFADPALLTERTIETLFYMHGQPPLFNAFLAAVLKVFPASFSTAFHAVYLGFGLMLVFAFYGLLIRLGSPAVISLIATLIFMVSPAVILYENWLFYSYPPAALLMLSAVKLHDFNSRGHPRDGFIFFALISSLALMKNTYHVGWLVCILCGLLILLPSTRKRTLIAAFFPVLLALSPYVKNAALHGSFNASTWFGMNLANVAGNSTTPQQKWSLFQGGAVSEAFQIGPFRPLGEYPLKLRATARTGIPILDQETKPQGQPNFHNINYVGISRQLGKDAMEAIKAYPCDYMATVGFGIRLYFMQSGHYSFLTSNAKRIGDVIRLYNWILITPTGYESYALLFSFLVALSYSVHMLVLRRSGPNGARRATILFLGFNIFYNFTVSNLFEVGENARFKFDIEPFLWIFLVLFLVDGYGHMRSLRAKKAGNE